jgi:uncharacterized protein
LYWTLLFAALAAALQVTLTLAVIVQRVKTGVLLGDGGNKHLLKRIRVHANFLEVVPMALLMLAVLELGGLASVYLIGLGSSLIFARLLHAASMLFMQNTWGRKIGTLLSLWVLSAQAVFCVWLFVLRS